ncbi:hypothetical protein MMC25_006013 [Agyrium rufum]|nr:hypothetical protein [Agyrium rufum]
MLTTITVLAFAAFAYGIVLVIYRLTLHPLAGFPGPKLTAATKWWEFYIDVIKGNGGQFGYEVDRMHDKYGPIVRINPDEIHVKDPEWIDILYSGPGQVRDKYSPAAHMSGVPLGTFGTIDHYVHRRRRGAVKAFVSKGTVRRLESVIREKIDLLCKRLDEHLTKQDVVDLTRDYLAWSTDSVFNYLDSEPLGLLTDPERAEDWKQTLRAVVELTPLVKQMTWIMPVVLKVKPWVVKLFSPDLARVLVMHRGMQDSAAKARLEWETQTKEQIESSPSSRPNAYRAILNSSLPPPEKEVDRVAQEILTILVGGSATTSRVMARLTYHMCDTPAILERLRDELSAVEPDPLKTPPLDELEQMPYLTAVIKETLRISTALTSRLPLISPQKPLQYQNWIIPPGTPVSMTISTILVEPSIFKDPYDFIPERWLGPPEEQARLDRYFLPFGKGTRMCIGMNFAWAELFLVTATVFRRFDFVLHDCDRERDVDIKRDCFLGEPSKKSKGIRARVSRAAN